MIKVKNTFSGFSSLKVDPPYARRITLLGLALILIMGAYESVHSSTRNQLKVTDKSSITRKDLKLQLPFLANNGQFPGDVGFYAHTFNGAFYVTNKGELIYLLAQPQMRGNNTKRKKSSEKVKIWPLKEIFVNALPQAPHGIDKSRSKVNFFIGSDRRTWKTNIPTYNSVRLGEIYSGIDLVLKAYGKNVEKIFVVQPGADVKTINIKLKGTKSLRINDNGELEIETGLGIVKFNKPHAYQQKNEIKQPVQVDYILNGDVYGFKVANYDTSLPLIIDPCLAYSTYLGGTSNDMAYDIAVDADAVYLVGATYSLDFPISNAVQPVNAGASDAFVTKLVPSGDTFVVDYSTYLGGSLNDYGYGIAVDSAGIVVATGETWSQDFPMEGSYDKKIGGEVDVWVAKLLPDGSLDCSTYLGGGGGAEAGYAVALDSSGNAYITGVTQASNFPVTPAAAFTQSRGKVDVFVSTIDFSGSKCSLLYSTFLGGNGDDEGYGIAFHGNTVLVTGITSSPDFHLHGTVLSDFLNGPTDGFLTVFSADLQAVHYSTFVGGNGEDTCEAIALDAITSDLYLTGSTSSTLGFPGCESGCSLGGLDAFVLKLETGYNPESVYVGGTGDDVAYGIAIDSAGNIFIAGQTNSPNLPQTDPEASYSGSYDAFLSKLRHDAGSYTFTSSVYFGGSADDAGYSISLDSGSNVYLAGSTYGFAGEEESDLDAFIAVIADLDTDADGVADPCDNCPESPNGPALGTCTNGDLEKLGEVCYSDSECGSTNAYCSMNQEDFDGGEGGDACDDDDDNDGLTDIWEITYGDSGGWLNPQDTDTDNDGIPDGEEDFDEGGLLNTEEQGAGSNPHLKDTDGDAWSDLMEVQAGTIPTDITSVPGANIFFNGIFVDKNDGSDLNLGTAAYPLKSIHAAFDRLNILEKGLYTIRFLTTGIYSIGDPEPDAPLTTGQNVIIEAAGITIDGTGASSWMQGFVFSPLSSEMTINGLNIVNFNEAVVFNMDGGCATLYNVNISACRTGLQLVEAYQLEVDLTTSLISGCQTGVEFAGEGSDNTISNGSIQNNVGEAVKVSGGTGNRLVNSSIEGSGSYGLKIEMGVEDFTVSGGMIQNTDVGIGFATDGVSLSVTGATIQSCLVGIEFLENYLVHVDLGESPDGTLITDCDVGILFRAGSSNNTVRNGSVSGNGDGIRFEACNEAPDENQIINTIVSNNIEDGIAILAGSGNLLTNVQVTGSKNGVLMDPGSSYNVLSGGSVSGNGQNFVLDGSNNTVENLTLQTFGQISGKGNQLVDITLDGQSTEAYGLLFDQGSEELILQDVTIRNYDVGIGFATDAACISLSGVAIQYCRIGMDIRENYMLDIDLGDTVISFCETGIEISAGSSNNIIRNGVVENNTLDGILVDGCTETPEENQIVGTTVQNNNRNGIALLAGFDNEVIGCTVTGNNLGQMTGGYGGVTVMNGSGAVKRSRIHHNGCTGVYADDSAVAEIAGNLIYGNPEGIRLALVSDVTVASNTITANDTAGLVIEDGALPLVKYNILYGNGTGIDPSTDVLLEGDFEPTNLVENNIGTVNQIDLPPTNLSVDPLFCVSDPVKCADYSSSEDYTLQPTSLCIDGTTATEPGIDVNSLSRPKGLSWDLGALETSTFRDVDDDGLPDPWEEEHFGSNDCPICGAEEDFDGDGVSNLQEYQEGSNPNNPVYVAITSPATSPHFTNNASITISGTSVNAGSITVTNGIAYGLESWSADVSLGDGGNVILVTAEGTVASSQYSGTFAATDTITVIKDSAAPTVTVLSPTNEGTYTTTSDFITLSGLANDDTEIESVSWEVVVGDTQNGTANGTNSWTAGPIQLPTVTGEPVSVTVQVTATDIFGKLGSEDIVITRVPGATNVDEDLSDQGSEPSADNPLDVDGDFYLNDDEIACGSDPLNDPGSGLPATPPNYANMTYPSGHEKEGYFWPDCLNPDIDADGLPNWWEEEYFAGSPTDGVAGADDDGDGQNNFEEYQSGTNPTVAQTIAFSVTVIDTGNGNGLPEFGKTFRVDATWIDSSPAPAQAVFSLKMSSNYPGRAENDPDPADMAGGGNYSPWYDYHGFDFGLTAGPLASLDDCNSVNCFNQGTVTINDIDDGVVDGIYTAYVHAWDYGGRTKVLVTDPVSGNYLGQIWVPVNSDKNGISSAWNIPVDPTVLDPNADTDTIIFENPGSYTAPLGDDFSHFEEYRGIVRTTSQTPPGEHEHLRLNPFRKDLFVRAAGFYGQYTFAYGNAFAVAGIDVHDTTNWGHDATEDGSFFVYYRQGEIVSISGNVVNGVDTNWSSAWPRHEWEFKLDGDSNEKWAPIRYWENSGNDLTLDFEYGAVPTGSYGYKIRKPVTHINVLIIRHDKTGLLGSPDGRIRFVSASPPSQQNPFGTRYWRWATKGYAWCQTTANQASMYGLAVTLEKPLYSYFYDTPYVDGSTWGSSWDPPDTVLNPLSFVEDQTDQLDPIDGVMGDAPDGNWDGDRRTTDFTGTLNPFDINGNDRVELPLATDPYDIDPYYEYTLSHVLMHTITHEMAHALAGPSHTNDPHDLMYRYSNNWSRHDRLCDYYRAMLRIHNITR
jgi:hypothetical protein